MVDKEEIYNRFKEIDEGINYLRNITPELLKIREKFILSRYYLQLIVEGIFTVGNQIIANNNFRKPTTYREIIKIIAENNVINSQLVEKLDFAAGLRNQLVHMYWKASPEQVLEIKANKLMLFEEFLKQVMKYIK